MNTFDLPARQSFVIELTGREDLSNGIALNSAAFNAARILGLYPQKGAIAAGSDADIAIIVGGTASARRHVQRIGRVLRPRDGKRARVYELAVEDSTETRYVAQRRSAVHRAPLTVASAAGGAP